MHGHVSSFEYIRFIICFAENKLFSVFAWSILICIMYGLSVYSYVTYICLLNFVHDVIHSRYMIDLLHGFFRSVALYLYGETLLATAKQS